MSHHEHYGSSTRTLKLMPTLVRANRAPSEQDEDPVMHALMVKWSKAVERYGGVQILWRSTDT